jgi:D-alanyl-lipoteichoic acid acyltransferase DltB (MBOAT superfamily)
VLFNSKIFVFLFLPASLAGFWLAARLAGPRAARLWLVGASLFFYGWWRPAFLPLLIGSVLANYFIGSHLKGSYAKAWLVAGLAFNLGLLGYFKYRGFFAALAGFPTLSLVLPLGISFFTFQQIMFLVDNFRGDIPEKTSLLDYACFVAFFPHLIAGPIVRPRDIIPQFQALRPLDNFSARLTDGIEIFLLGLAKKVVLADSFARLSDPGFAAAVGHHLTLIEAWTALLAYTLQIYFDFSGYSDMAIGIARMFGIAFPRNFNSPYQAQNISEFWRRWNITLSQFLRDYLYIPLGGSRRGERRRLLNLMITMLLGGLWHGAALKFLVWGGLHGFYLIIQRAFSRLPVHVPPFIARGLTLAAVILAWVPFRAQNFATAASFYKSLAGLNGIAIPTLFARLLPALPAFIHVVPVLPYLGDARTLSLPLALAMLLTGWTIVLTMPNLQSFSTRRRSLATIGSFAFTMQALVLAPSAIPFLYYQF